MTFDQAESDLRCEWGPQGVAHLAPVSDVVIIVDVLSFSTCVDVATSRGAVVFPYRWSDASAAEYAAALGAELAQQQRGGPGYSLSPTSLLDIPRGTRLVLPSPNGSTLTLGTGTTVTFAGCLRNCRAVAGAARGYGRRIAVIPAGERWPDGSLRPAFEDLVGAGAILRHCQGTLSPEAQAAVAAYHGVESHLAQLLRTCSSGKELLARGFEQDVTLAAALDTSACVPTFVQGAYRHGDA